MTLVLRAFLHLGTFEIETQGSGGEATFYYTNAPCGGMPNPIQLDINGIDQFHATNPSNES